MTRERAREDRGLGAGENLNEHFIGGGWPPANTRHEMLVEAVGIIRALFGGDYVNYRGTHFEVDSARLWDCPEGGVPIEIALSTGPTSAGTTKTIFSNGRRATCCQRCANSGPLVQL